MEKILLYYCFYPLDNPFLVMKWQKELCLRLGLKGRIIVSSQGINGTIGGDVKALKEYRKETRSFEPFTNIEFKVSKGSKNDFPRLSVKVRDELVAFKADSEEIVVDENGVVGGGVHLKPDDVHLMVEKYGDQVVFVDGRNANEAAIGKFKDAVVMDVNTSKDFIPEIESGKYDDLKNKKVITYCTGGIRCELLSVLMKNRGFDEVYQIDGGIVKYGEKFKDDGLWEGSLRVFDDRMIMKFSDESKVIGHCSVCESKTESYFNCLLSECHQLFLLCEECQKEQNNCFDSLECKNVYYSKL